MRDVSQSRLASLVEAVVNTAIGFVVSVVASVFFLALVGVSMSAPQLLSYTALMTVLSIARGYVVRRAWNAEWWRKREQFTEARHIILVGEDHAEAPMSREEISVAAKS